MNPIRNEPRNGREIFRPSAALAGLAFLALILTGCSMLRMPHSQPKAQVDSLMLTNGSTGPVTFPVLQQQVMRFADTYAATVAQACDEISANNTNPVIRLTALRWKLGQAHVGLHRLRPDRTPAVNALNLLVLVSMSPDGNRGLRGPDLR